MKSSLEGTSLIGSERPDARGRSFQAVNPSTGDRLPVRFFTAGEAEIDRAVKLAGDAFEGMRALTGRDRGALLRAIAGGLEERIDDLVERGTAETALPDGRIRMETARTCAQLRMFAGLVEEGSWVDARIDHGDTERKPAPKPDLRALRVPLGPVAVFGAGNFPIAFSVAGGDTASALAAGCPVVVKAHPNHPGTAEIAGLAVREAVAQNGFPPGTFSLLFDEGINVGKALVTHPGIRAVGFTGSRQGGSALMAIARERPEPIPVYAEMSSVNPVFLLPGAVQGGGSGSADTLAASITLGAGQFCTCPGLLFALQGPDTDAFAAALRERLAAVPPAPMLARAIADQYRSAVNRRKARRGVEPLFLPEHWAEGCAHPCILRTDAATFISEPSLMEEIFGPAALLVVARDRGELLVAAENLEGQLTATVHGTEADLEDFGELAAILERKAGRLLFNQVPTGVEVCPAMVHGGPYPATGDGRSTSVGTAAIDRFTRRLAYQNWPDALLPDELKESNPLGITRLVDGAWK
ncbi:MAG: aldehyde dehydrogenase (NADP(+)) [Puniceicoccaceae bacterium]|nr:MAG: aldehyde dehydrogenase (NADP(+)) [Puniceicoccaceae bacterium]